MVDGAWDSRPEQRGRALSHPNRTRLDLLEGSGACGGHEVPYSGCGISAAHSPLSHRSGASRNRDDRAVEIENRANRYRTHLTLETQRRSVLHYWPARGVRGSRSTCGCEIVEEVAAVAEGTP